MTHKLLIATLLLLCTASLFALTGFGESNTFGITEETLPVVLSSFTATGTAQNYVQLLWVTQSETNLNGYYVYRGNDDELGTAIMVSPQIQPSNTSSQHSYIYTDMEIHASGQYYYWLQSIEMDGNSNFHGPITVLVNLDGNDPGTPNIPLETGLRAIYPNPFNPSTTISYQLQSPSDVSINIYNLRGQIIQTLNRSHSAAGYYTLVFDGKDSAGNTLPSGVYQMVMTAGKTISMQKIVLMK